MIASSRTTDCIIVGAGHAGLAMSRCLSARGIDHALFESYFTSTLVGEGGAPALAFCKRALARRVRGECTTSVFKEARTL